MFKRILTQSNAFLETYKLFNNQFTFKKMPLRDYLNIMSDRTVKARQHIEELRKSNPEMAAKQDEQQRMDEIKKQENYIMMRMKLGIAERNRDLKPEEDLEGQISKIMIKNTNVVEEN